MPDFAHLTIPHFLTPLSPSSFLGLRFTIQGFQLSKPHVIHASVGQPSMAPTHKVSPTCDWPKKDTGKAPTRSWSPSSAWLTGKVSLPVWPTQLPPNPVPQTQPFMEDEWAILKVSECCLLNRQQTTAPYQDEVWEAWRGVRATGFPVTFRYWPAPVSACIHSCSHCGSGEWRPAGNLGTTCSIPAHLVEISRGSWMNYFAQGTQMFRTWLSAQTVDHISSFKSHYWG